MYNCNKNDRVKIAEEFFMTFNDMKAEVYNDAIHKIKNNETGICGALTWLEIRSTMLTESSPFNRNLERFPLRPPTKKAKDTDKSKTNRRQ